MIDALSETYKELAAEAMGIPPGQISILMVHLKKKKDNFNGLK